jgi:hypothetical protein
MSLLPAPWKGRFASRGLVHHFEHVLAFCTLFLLCSDRSSDARKNIGVAIAVFAFGALLEALQTAAYRIPLEYADILDDGLGVAVGLVARFAVGHRQDTPA